MASWNWLKLTDMVAARQTRSLLKDNAFTGGNGHWLCSIAVCFQICCGSKYIASAFRTFSLLSLIRFASQFLSSLTTLCSIVAIPASVTTWKLIVSTLDSSSHRSTCIRWYGSGMLYHNKGIACFAKYWSDRVANHLFLTALLSFGNDFVHYHEVVW